MTDENDGSFDQQQSNIAGGTSRADRERIRQALATQISSSAECDTVIEMASYFPTNTILPLLISHGGETFPGTRRPIPVSTVEWTSTNLSQMVPMHGIDFLGGVEQVCIQQTVELNDLLSNQESESLYTVKVPRGETLFLASESSTSCHRTVFGTNRAFSIRLFDHTRQEAMVLRRRLACNFCLFGCYLQKMEVWTPPGNLLGTIEQDWTLFSPSFTIKNAVGNPLYVIEGPNMCVCAMYSEADFKVLTPDKSAILGSISHQWDQLMIGFALNVVFPERNLDVGHKALILGAAFLLEYMFFLQTRRLGCCNFC